MILAQHENPEVWKKNIYSSLRDLSDIELQRQTWSGIHSISISSFTETLAILYDDFDFTRYIKYYESINGKNHVYNLFNELDEMIESYKESGYNFEKESNGYLKILNDNNWIKITKKAEDILNQLIVNQEE